MNLINQYVQRIGSAISSRNGPAVRQLIDLTNAQAQEAVFSAKQYNARWNPASATGGLPEGWSEFVSCHCACLASLQAGSAVEAYDHAVNALQPFVKIFRDETEAWVVQPMHSVVHNLWSVAQAADTEMEAGGGHGDKLGDCADQLRKCFAVSLQASGNQDKKQAALDIVNVSIKIYFKLNTLRLCKNLIRTVDSRQFAPFHVFPASQRVTYQFYVGRLAVFDEDYHVAQSSLEYALRHCPRNAVRNKARVLKYLVPVKLLLGTLPTQRLIQKFCLQQYQPIIAALRTGDVQLFNHTMGTQQFQFIQEGTYLLLEKLRPAVYRRLLRAVHAVHAQAEPAKAAQIPLSWFQAALSCQATAAGDQVAEGVEMDMDEIECVCANLIYRKYVKGYISHKNQVMVVAKTDPFPPLSSVVLKDS